VIVGGDWDDGIFGVLVKVDDAMWKGVDRNRDGDGDGAAMSGTAVCMIDEFIRTPFLCVVMTMMPI
jgi:hypothetical protein